jgi:hypothetical protein
MTSGPLRPEYEACVMALRGQADTMWYDGLTPEAIARAMHVCRTHPP